MQKAATNVKKVLSTIDNTLQELKEGIDPEKLSITDKQELKADIAELKALALEIKQKIVS